MGSPTSPRLPRISWVALIVLVTGALVAAACGGDLDVHGAIEGSLQPEAQLGVEGRADLPQPVTVSLAGLLTTSPDRTEAYYAYLDLNDAIGAAIAESTSPEATVAAVDAAVLAGYEGPDTAESAAGVDLALGGQAIDIGFADPKQAQGQGGGTDPVRDPRLKVYFVNGINNTMDFARGTAAQLVQSLHHDVTHFYNPSAFNPAEYTEAWCARSIAALFAEQRQSLLLTQLMADEAAADAIEQASNSGALAWFFEAVTRSFDGVSRDVSSAVDNTALTAAELAMARACAEVDDIKDTLQPAYELGSSLLEWLDNTEEVVEHRLAAALGDSSLYNPELVELIKTDISQGRRVVLVSHSHGTMMAKFALEEIDRWYREQWLGDCPADVDAAGVAPIAALYVSPGFTVDVDAQQAAVMVEGDFLSMVGGNASTVAATGSQVDLGPVDRHDLRRYLESGTASLAQVQAAFAQLADHVAGVPDGPEACADDPTASGDGPEVAPAPSEDPVWVLVDTVVNANGTDPHPYWKDVEVSPGELSWVFDDGDPTFGAVFYVTYDLPPEQLVPGQRYEIPVIVSGVITTGESQRFTGGEVILYVNHGWDGSVGVQQSCVAGDGAIECDEPAANSGSLPFTAPTGGETFEFQVDVLNCGACEVAFRYELR